MPAVVVAEAELARRAQHAVRPLAAQLAALDLHAVGHHGAERGQRHEVADRHVERAAADLQGLAVAAVDVDELDPVGVGVRPQVEHPGHDDAVEALADALDRLDRHARGRSVSSPSAIGVGLDRRELAQPGQEHLHQNCSRKRTSLTMQLADVVDAVAHQRQAVDAEAEGEARPLLGVEADRREDVGVHHAAAAELQPPVCPHVRQPEPSQKTQLMSYSADGSVNGKYDGPQPRVDRRRRSRPW